MDLRAAMWLPKIKQKPSAKCFDRNPHQLLQHMYDELLIPKWEYYYKWFKNAYGTIKQIDPIDYIDLCADLVHKTTVKAELDSCNKENVVKYAELMAKGEIFPLSYIDLKYRQQEGRHRCLAAAALGVKSVPIVMIEDYDYEAQHKDLDFNKDYMFIKDAVLMNIKNDEKVTKIYTHPKSKTEAQKIMDNYA